MVNELHTDNFHFQLDEFYLDLGEGEKIRIVEKEQISSRPFPGLRPFKTSEFLLFHGRDGQAEELINRLSRNHFLAVIGSSGTGKSSLIRAGLIPQLLGGYLKDAGTKWNIAICRPGRDPVENLAISLARVKARSSDPASILREFTLIKTQVESSIYGILEVNDILNPPLDVGTAPDNLLIIVDQFEELFRFKRDDLGKPGIEKHFIDLLLKASDNIARSIYVIITMRSEFLGDCSKYRGLPEAINEGQYLVPQLSREQIKEVIESPIKMAGKQIEPGLVELLANEIEQSKSKNDLDQLPILQHALMRTYQEALNQKSARITLDHYKAVGGIENALSNHAELKYHELGDQLKDPSFKQRIAKLIFQALTDSRTDEKAGRRPTALKVLYSIAGSISATPELVNEVINAFRDTDTSFIMPPLHVELYPDLVMDISHESLMRQWARLKDWVQEESGNGQVLLRLADAQKLYAKGEKGLLRDKELYPISRWYHSLNPQPAWAERYLTDARDSFEYLKQSERSEKSSKTIKRLLIVVGIIGAIIGLFLLNQNQQKGQLRQQLQTQDFVNRSRIAMEKDDDALAAALYMAEAISLGENDSLLTGSNKYLPVYYLSKMFYRKLNLKVASFSKQADSLYFYDIYSLCHTWDVKNDSMLDESKCPPLLTIFGQSKFEKEKALRILNTRWGIDSAGRGTIFSNKLKVSVKIPKSIESIYMVTPSPDSRMVFTHGTNTGGIFAANLFAISDKATPVGLPMIHEDSILSSFFSTDATRLLTWSRKFIFRLFTKIPAIDVKKEDADIPSKLFKIQLQAITGARLNSQNTGVEPLGLNEWKTITLEWKRMAEEHYLNCKFKENNYWALCVGKTTR